MQMTIEVADWMVLDIERPTRRRFDAAEVEETLRAYYSGLATPLIEPQTWSDLMKRSIYGAAIDTSCRF